MTPNRLHFLLQSNLVNEEDQTPYLTALEATQLAYPDRMSWSQVKLVPFGGTVEPEADYGPCVFPIGSTSMLAASRRYGWTPGVVYDETTFHFDAWRDNWGAANLINGTAATLAFSDGVWYPSMALEGGAEERVFIRPAQDLKTFTGHVTTVAEWKAWIERVRKGQTSLEAQELRLDTRVIVAPVKTITREWRTWVVDGKVRAASQYAFYGQRVREAHAPLDVLLLAQRVIDYWTPADAFVLDIGEVDSKLGIVEVNTLNSSGIYAADMASVYGALVKLYS